MMIKPLKKLPYDKHGKILRYAAQKDTEYHDSYNQSYKSIKVPIDWRPAFELVDTLKIDGYEFLSSNVIIQLVSCQNKELYYIDIYNFLETINKFDCISNQINGRWEFISSCGYIRLRPV